MYYVYVANLTGKVIFYGPYKSIIYVALPFIGHLSCNKVKRLIKSICAKNKCLFDLKFVFVNNFTIEINIDGSVMEAFEFNSKKLYISELLSNVQFYLNRCSIDSIIKVILIFYFPHEITDAKDILWIAASDNLGPKQRRISSQSRSQHEADLNDILQGIESLDQLGIQNVFFACTNVDRMPG